MVIPLVLWFEQKNGTGPLVGGHGNN